MFSKSICTFAICLLLVTTALAAPYTVNGNGTVSDGATGLIWQEPLDNNSRDWQSALDYCNGLILAGEDDWRVPNIKELESLVDVPITGDFAIDETIFPGTAVSYLFDHWSSTTNAPSPVRAWKINFQLGNVVNSDKTSSGYTRCVR